MTFIGTRFAMVSSITLRNGSGRVGMFSADISHLQPLKSRFYLNDRLDSIETSICRRESHRFARGVEAILFLIHS